MSFDVSADAYQRFMGRYSEPLAAQFADLAGAEAISAAEPSASFVPAARDRLPAADIRQARAEQWPFAADAFDAALAQLVVHFMADPVLGLREMGRVTRPGGVVAACVWDHAGGRGPVSLFWSAARQVDPAAPDESDLAGARAGDLARLFAAAGLSGIQATELTVRAGYASFEAWWEPFTLGVGPAGAYVASLSGEQRAALRDQCRRLLPAAPGEIAATAWAATGHP
jgi:SAM-dependent methyltransferase